MADKLSGVESSAVSVLKRAVELDQERRFDEAVVCYQEGIQLLLEVVKALVDEGKKKRYREKISEYMDRAEEVKKFVTQQKSAKQHEQIHIKPNATGFSFERLFSRFIDKFLTEIEIEDPYIRSTHQIYNFLRFCELVVKCQSPVKIIKLTTGRDDDPGAQASQHNRLSQIVKSLGNHGIQLEINYSQTLHDREIRFNNGWIVKIGRGLDIYKATDNKFSIGFCDFDLRQCHETTVDIFHQNHVNQQQSS